MAVRCDSLDFLGLTIFCCFVFFFFFFGGGGAGFGGSLVLCWYSLGGVLGCVGQGIGWWCCLLIDRSDRIDE